MSESKCLTLTLTLTLTLRALDLIVLVIKYQQYLIQYTKTCFSSSSPGWSCISDRVAAAPSQD